MAVGRRIWAQADEHVSICAWEQIFAYVSHDWAATVTATVPRLNKESPEASQCTVVVALEVASQRAGGRGGEQNFDQRSDEAKQPTPNFHAQCVMQRNFAKFTYFSHMRSVIESLSAPPFRTPH